MSGIKHIPVCGDTVRMYKISNKRGSRPLYGKVINMYDTPVEHVKLYEIQDSDGKLHYATLDSIARINS